MDNNYNNGQQGEQQNVPLSGESNAQQGGQTNMQPNGQIPYGQPYMQDPNQFYGQVNGNGVPQPSDEGIGCSIASMVLGIIAILISCCFYPLAFVLAIIGLILGAVGLKKGAGRGMAITGIILSILSIAIAIFVIAFAFSFASVFRRG